ncbi:MAG: hypothetical protein H6835_09300 [Planctomycetes bacterium]|nr:hypothetical protein [Planctomycetota bacterium]
MQEPFFEPLRLIAESLDRLEIPYFVGGSVASTLHGEIRTTHDVDLVVELAEDDVTRLAADLSEHFFIDQDGVIDAIRHSSCCNLIHRTTAFKVDLFSRKDRPFSREEMARRHRVAVAGISLPIASAEDCVLSKLEWYEKGGRLSDRQWRDVQGILKAQRDDLDLAYLRLWAPRLDVVESLERALREAGLAPQP